MNTATGTIPHPLRFLIAMGICVSLFLMAKGYQDAVNKPIREAAFTECMESTKEDTSLPARDQLQLLIWRGDYCSEKIGR